MNVALSPPIAPDRMADYAQTARDRGLKVIIAGAGGAAHLPGMTAAHTSLPVLGVPVQSKALSGQDSLLSIVQMPAGIPVGTLAIGVPGAKNAALLAAAILATNDAALADRHDGARNNPLLSRKPCVTSDARPSLPEAAILPPGSVIGIVGGGHWGGCWLWRRPISALRPIFSPPNMTRQPCKSAMPRHWAIMRTAQIGRFCR